MTMPDPKLIFAGVVALVAIIAAYVVLVVLGHGSEATGLAPLVLTLLGFLGLGAHTTQRLSQQDTKLDVITHQTNGVLDGRIQQGADTAMRQVLREAGYHVPEAPPPPPVDRPVLPEVSAP